MRVSCAREGGYQGRGVRCILFVGLEKLYNRNGHWAGWSLVISNNSEFGLIDTFPKRIVKYLSAFQNHYASLLLYRRLCRLLSSELVAPDALYVPVLRGRFESKTEKKKLAPVKICRSQERMTMAR
jgi:hypothetical protein